MNGDYELGLTSEQDSALVEFLKAASKSHYKDPNNIPSMRDIAKSFGERNAASYFKDDAFDLSNPRTYSTLQWQTYLINLMYQAATERIPSRKTIDTAKKRLKAVKVLQSVLGHWPTAADIESTFPDLPKLDGSVLKLIDRDLEYLKSPVPIKQKAGRTGRRSAVKKRRV